MLKRLCTFVIASWLALFLSGYFANVPINSAYHEGLRRLWAKEENYRAVTRQAWTVEVRNHENLRLGMQEERVTMDETRREWAHEQEEQRNAMDEMRQNWNRERKEEEEEARKRGTISWEGLEAGHCLRYGVKEYTSTLSRVPPGFDSMEECYRKPMSIQGRDWLPSRCEELGFCGRVTGHWDVDINESSCKPWWVNYQDKGGCVEYGVRRYEASLENLHDTRNWENICMTTPMTINGRYHKGPTACANWGRGGLWPWGIWLVDDNSCRS
ncbi:hypothetical protein CPB84DRAFT_1690838 [Gymnopilus junonius]|uniref:Uncharacterized protein n=1 Tax=Gymnopilus junonius TaxID=109634 RepID=A0A9P5TF59_GYMJU|nr:hypothetical protein CPB84DRAFT_1690838 [Gymnopilus junonius]